MKCSSCLKEISDNARFCRFCGKSVAAATEVKKQVGETSCPSCGKIISAEAKFCRFCGKPAISGQQAAKGQKVDSTSADVEAKGFVTEKIHNYIKWSIQPNELAVKIDESAIEAYHNAKGVYITPGTKALFFVNGRYAAELGSGKYSFGELSGSSAERDGGEENKGRNRVVNFIRNIANHIANGVSLLFGRDRTSTHNNIGERTFYTIVLVRGVEFALPFDLGKVVTKTVSTEIGLEFVCRITNLNDFFEAQLVDKTTVNIDALANSLRESVLSVTKLELSKVPAEEVDNNPELMDSLLLRLRERVSSRYAYITVSAISMLTADNEALAKLREYTEQLYIAERELEHLTQRHDYLNRFDREVHSRELAESSENADFEALKAQSELARATTESEKKVAENKLRATEMISEEEIAQLEREIAQRGAMSDKQNEISLAREGEKWNLERARMQAELADERTNAELDRKKREKEDKINYARQAKALRMEYEQARHEREMESARFKHEADLARYKVTAGMTFEQIMASNPDITPEAAAALGKKYEAEAAAASNDRSIALQSQHSEDLKAILAQQMALTKDIVAAQSLAGTNALAEKQAELNRVHEDSERNQGRFLEGMQTTIESVASALKPEAKSSITAVFCPNCGKKHDGSKSVCDDCGTTL